MRQLTRNNPDMIDGIISKLPMRQLTKEHTLLEKAKISKLPMRQLTEMPMKIG